jgi:succinate-semialdehyde dehydrogenase/glutarate-semialdehyde dehydrogenase
MNFYSPPFPPAFSSFLLFKTRVALFGQKLVEKKLSFVDLKHSISTMSASSNGVANGAGGTCKIELKDPELLKTSCFVGGKFVPAAKEDGQGWFDVLNPATGELVAKVADGGKVTTQQAIETAKSAFDSWKKLTALERSAILKKWFDLIIQNAEDLGKIMTTEQGKPLPEAIGEIKYGASFVEFFAEEAKRLYGDIIPAGSETRALVLPQPVGVCGLVTPWNFPCAMLTRKAAPALAAGCTVVCKPSELTPLSALALCELAVRAGIPAGVLNVVTGFHAAPIGEELTTNPIVRKISFTGSTAVGKKLMQQSASTVKKVSLELGGLAPFIVMEDANLDAAVSGLIACKFRNNGQTCICANRVYVQSSIYDKFTEKVVEKVKTLRVGNGMESGVNLGPLINEKAVEKVERHVKDAVSKGAKVLLGGSPHSLGGLFYQPTVMTNMTDSMVMSCEETFGPVIGLFKFDTEEEVIKRANNTNYGLASYLYTTDLARAWRMAESLESGMVGLNEPMISNAMVPFGGVKESGIGREGSKYGIAEYVNLKYVLMGGIVSS